MRNDIYETIVSWRRHQTVDFTNPKRIIADFTEGKVFLEHVATGLQCRVSEEEARAASATSPITLLFVVYGDAMTPVNQLSGMAHSHSTLVRQPAVLPLCYPRRATRRAIPAMLPAVYSPAGYHGFHHQRATVSAYDTTGDTGEPPMYPPNASRYCARNNSNNIPNNISNNISPSVVLGLERLGCEGCGNG